MYKKNYDDINTHILSETFRRRNRGSHFNSLINVEIITWNEYFYFYQIVRLIK